MVYHFVHHCPFIVLNSSDYSKWELRMERTHKTTDSSLGADQPEMMNCKQRGKKSNEPKHPGDDQNMQALK